MALKKLLSKLEKDEWSQQDFQESFPSHFQFNNGNGLGYTSGNSTSFFDNPGTGVRQRSLQFGEYYSYDRPGAKDKIQNSREPFMGKNRSIPDLDKNASRFLGFIDSFSDGFIRGGIATAVSRSAKDVARLTKFFLSQRGIGFLTQQLALQATQPDILAGNAGGKAGQIIGLATGLELNNNRTFNLGLNILGQAAINFTGVHLNRSGLSPIWQDSQTYSKLAVEKADIAGSITNNELEEKSDFGIGGSLRGNRLLTLYRGRMVASNSENGEDNDEANNGFFGNIGSKIKDLTGESGNSILYEYKRGPGSIYGLGKTTIYRYQDSSLGAKYATDGVDSKQDSYPLVIDTEGYKKLTLGSEKETRTEGNFTNARLEQSFGEETPYEGYIENRINTGTPGDIDIKTTAYNLDSYNIYSFKTMDKINALDIYQKGLAESEKYNRDLIKFYFDVCRPGRSKHRVVFRAFLDTFGDNFRGNWDKFNYAGRGEPFFTYQNFDREVNFSFKIAAQTRHEMRPLYRKLNYLASTTAPDYSSDGRMRGTFVRANIGSYISNIPGFFSSMNITWQKDYPWEIAMDSPERGDDTDMIVVPHVLDVQCNFTPIHDFIPKTSTHESPFILNNKASWLDYGVIQPGMHSIPVDRRQVPIKLTPTKVAKIETGETPQLIRTTQTMPPSTYDPMENEDSTPAVEQGKEKKPLFKFSKNGKGKEKLKARAKSIKKWFKHLNFTWVPGPHAVRLPK
jgi:hypothetical protein